MSGAIVLTASAGSFPGLGQMVRDLPVAIEERPLLRFAPPDDWTPLDAALTQLKHTTIAFTSPRAARACLARLRARSITWATLGPGHPDVWAAGVRTAQIVGEAIREVRVPDESDVGVRGAAVALADALLAAGVRGPVLFPCGDHRRDELPARLRARGIVVDEVICYRSVFAGEVEAREAAARATVLVVASPTVAELLARACPSAPRPALLAVGPTTAAASRAAGWPPAAVATHPTTEAVGAAARTLLL